MYIVTLHKQYRTGTTVRSMAVVEMQLDAYAILDNWQDDCERCHPGTWIGTIERQDCRRSPENQIIVERRGS